MLPEIKDKKTRTPRSYESIEKGALLLLLPDRVDLVKKLKASIDQEVQELQNAANNAKKITDELK